MTDLVLGRGKLYFSRFKSDNVTPEGFRYIGNTPQIALTIDRETLDHFDSDAGVREKDDSVTLETNRSATFTTDNVVPENIALFFFGSATDLTITLSAGLNWSFTDVKQGRYYQVGRTAANPQGVRNITNVDVQVLAVSQTINTDYTIDLATGLLYIVPGGGIADDDDISVDYDQAAGSGSRVISGSDPVDGAMQYVAENPKGSNRDMFLPKVSISPNGDWELKGDEWQEIPFSVEILKPTDSEAIIWESRQA